MADHRGRHRLVDRFPRTLDEAFRTPRYASAIVYYTRAPLWRRALRALLEWL